MSIEAITALWEAKQAEALAKRHEADILEAEARGLRSALDALIQLRPVQADFVGPRVQTSSKRSLGLQQESDVPRRTGSGGRQPGAISNKWKRHLIELSPHFDIFSKEQIAQLVYDREERLMKPSEIQRLFENFSRYGHVKIIDDGLYNVPDEASAKFRAVLRDENPFVDDDEDPSDESANSHSDANHSRDESLHS